MRFSLLVKALSFSLGAFVDVRCGNLTVGVFQLNCFIHKPLVESGFLSWFFYHLTKLFSRLKSHVESFRTSGLTGRFIKHIFIHKFTFWTLATGRTLEFCNFWYNISYLQLFKVYRLYFMIIFRAIKLFIYTIVNIELNFLVLDQRRYHFGKFLKCHHHV